jgi:hypothetical protein
VVVHSSESWNVDHTAFVKRRLVRATASESPMLGPSAWRQVPEWHSSPARDTAADDGHRTGAPAPFMTGPAGGPP